MGKVNIPGEPNTNTTVYSQFKGVHLTDPSLCDINHSPYALNLISNNEGLPEIRPGWRVLCSQLGAPVVSLGAGVVDGTDVFLAQIGNALYKWDKTGSIEKLACPSLTTFKGKIFFAKQGAKEKAWILSSGQYLVYDGTTVQDVSAIATVPVILIGKKPTGGGTVYQPVNLLQPKRTEYFAGDGTSKVYQLSAANLDNATAEIREVTAGGIATWVAFTVNQTTGQVTFATAPPAPTVSGQDNIYITYSKTVTGYADRIKQCTVQSEYGETGTGRIFFTGNPAYRNYDWWSELNDPSYFPDINYGVTGNANTAIMGYSKIGKYQLIVKEDGGQEGTIFLRYPSVLASGVSYFKLEPGVSGTGAIAKGSFISLIDEPLFLARTGLYAITSNNITAERTLQNRSYYVDETLTKEKLLSEAVATEWNGYYLLAVGGKVYAFDSKSKEAHGVSFVYNCFVWNNIDAKCFMVRDGELYFGDSAGRICKLSTDKDGLEKYNDNEQAIEVAWSTKLDNDGIPFMTKTMQKKGSGITTKPFTRSTYEVAIVTEKSELDKLIKQFNRDIFDLADVDLDRFSLESAPFAKFTPFKKKIKKYESLQIIVRGKAKNEGFGIYNITKQWLPVNHVKR